MTPMKGNDNQINNLGCAGVLTTFRGHMRPFPENQRPLLTVSLILMIEGGRGGKSQDCGVNPYQVEMFFFNKLFFYKICSTKNGENYIFFNFDAKLIYMVRRDLKKKKIADHFFTSKLKSQASGSNVLPPDITRNQKTPFIYSRKRMLRSVVHHTSRFILKSAESEVGAFLFLMKYLCCQF